MRWSYKIVEYYKTIGLIEKSRRYNDQGNITKTLMATSLHNMTTKSRAVYYYYYYYYYYYFIYVFFCFVL